MIVDTLETLFVARGDQYTNALKGITSSTKDLAKAQQDLTADGSGGGGIVGYFKLATAELDSALPGLQEVLSVLKAIGLAGVGAGVAFTGLTGSAIQAYAEFDSLTQALKVYGGTAKETSRQLERLKEIAAKPGLGYEQAIQASVRLQAVGFDARLAERAILGFGNAIASAGGGKEQLDGVILALGQIVSLGQVTADNINQISNNLPQIRDLMKQAFGTASSEELQKRGVTPEQFVLGIIAALERMPKAADNAQSALDNFSDTANRLLVQFGDASAKVLFPAFSALGDFGAFIESKNIIGHQVERLYEATSATSDFAESLRKAMGISSQIGKEIGDVAKKSENLGEGLQEFIKEFGDLLDKPTNFLAGAKDFGDFLVRGASLAITTLGYLPDIFEAATAILNEELENIKKFISLIISIINGLIGIINRGIDVSGPLGADFHIGGDGGDENKRINTLVDPFEKKKDGKPDTESPGQKALRTLIEQIVDEAKGLYGESQKFKPTNTIDGDQSKGGFKSSMLAAATDKNTQALERNTNAQERIIDLERQLYGGGSFAESATSEVAVARARRGAGAPELDQISQLIERYVTRVQRGTMGQLRRQLGSAGTL